MWCVRIQRVCVCYCIQRHMNYIDYIVSATGDSNLTCTFPTGVCGNVLQNLKKPFCKHEAYSYTFT